MSERGRSGPGSPVGVRMPASPTASPLLAIARRFALALVIVLLNWGLVIVESSSYKDAVDGDVSALDALYYTTVTLSTTGYGDITPVTDGARLLNALLVTPMRLLFVVILVGTTIQALTERSREQFRLSRWRSRVRNHVVVVGYGAKGRNAVRELLLKGQPHDRIVVVDTDRRALAEAAQAGFVTVEGSATRTDVLTEALVDRAATVIVALNRDDTSVLVTLTARQVSPTVTVVATAREAENAGLLRQSGAASVIVTSETAGRLLGLAAGSPHIVDVVEDLLSFGSGIDLVERDVAAGEVGHAPSDLVPAVLAVVRGAERHPFDDPAVRSLQPGDRVVQVQTPQADGGPQTGVRDS
ncbi:MAG TPA: potassium channel family protein [Kineosporiaceae bacterium]|nr:potassium channel family protein [Kineosporiaceae bacterium]